VFIDGTEAEVIRAIQDGTDFAGAPNMKWFSMLLDIWYERETAHPDFNWVVLKAPRVKVQTGSQLAQAHRNGLIPLNTDDVRKFALENYTSPDNRVARPAVVLIGEVGDSRDIDLLVDLAQRGAGRRRLFHEGITALSYICSSEAKTAIDSLMSTASRDEKAFAEALLKDREHVLSTWCG
jgi:hypothetical protein